MSKAVYVTKFTYFLPMLLAEATGRDRINKSRHLDRLPPIDPETNEPLGSTVLEIDADDATLDELAGLENWVWLEDVVEVPSGDT